METFLSNKHLKSIGNYAFQDNYQLNRVVLREELTSIGNGAFEGCIRLKEIEFSGTKWQWKEISIGENAFPPSLKRIVCSDGVVNMS